MPEYDANTPLTIETDVVVQNQAVEFDIVPDDIVVLEVAVGIPGPTGVVKVVHGTDPNVPRPVGAAIVYWKGSVKPNFGDPDDWWI